MTTRTYARLLAIIFLCFNLFLLTSCQLQSRTNTDVVHLTLWHGINPPPNRDVFNRLVERFNQTHEKIQVEALYVGQADQQLPKILTAVIGNAAPDLLWFAPTLTGQLKELGAIRSLDDWWNSSPLKAELNPALLPTMQLDGKIWSVPMATNNVGLFYRPSLLKAAGITELPKTWAELRQTAQRLTRESGGNGKRYGLVLSLGKGEWTVFTWLPFFYSSGGELVRDGSVNLLSEEAIAALQFWADLRQDGSTILSAPERGYEQDDFIAGRVAMQLTGPWTLGFLKETPIKNDYGVMPIPQNREAATVLGGENLFVMKTTRDVVPRSRRDREKAALEFLEYILGEEFQTQWALETGYLPVNLKAQQSKTYQAYLAKNPALQVFIEQTKNARSRPLVPAYVRLSDNLGRAIEATLLGTPPREALTASQKRLDLAVNRN
ncbi:ABC transporter substrate-binding protein [Oscillatoria sp. FACHB-1406]|uniref:ABC transporter substrate-binding protein n=1 Tax=Oscillatoria sp. FACHB-1406 TaxID=2692846 RepID=UPI00168447DB|nr:ABC transporter substrate-binding protein [Oscillatoria sp. FACHB-1406]MBD2576419.1 ABC transporter substrate-binding protein [Oscillatoria sp. FACHB-1406]